MSMMRALQGRWGLLLFTCFVFVLLILQPVRSQPSSCEGILNPVVITTNSTVSEILMSCTVPPELVQSEITMETWQWSKLAADNTHEVLPLTANIATTSLSNSTYLLNVSCPRSGIYQSLYRAPNNSCIHSCSIFVEVEEVQPQVIMNVFSVYRRTNVTSQNTIVDVDSFTTKSEPNQTEVSVGICNSMFYTGLSGCVVGVSGRWFKDGNSLNPQGNASYVVSSSGELRIVSLEEVTTGEYVCVTMLPWELGSFVTVAVEIEISAEPTPTTPIATTMTTASEGTFPTRNGVTLREWEVGLIVANVIVVVILVGLVMVGMACFVTRRKRDVKERPAKKNGNGPRPRSMVEHIQMIEEETEEVDFVGPIEVPFSSILFEELLHKGTFKVIHHAVINSPMHGVMSLPVAVKRLKDDKSELGMEELMAEAYTLRAVQDKAGSHPNVVSLVGVTTQGGPTCLLLEYIPHGRLDDFISSLKDGPLPEWYVRFVKDTIHGAYHKHVSGDLMRVILQVAEGMKFLTDHGFIHRDLSTRTILIGERLNVKIADPGIFHEGYYYVVTEREHFLQDMAPECLWEKRYSVWSDVWSFGILAYKVIALESVPFPDATVNDLYDKMVGGERPQLLASFSNEMFFLLQRCWQFIAVERPTFENIVTDLKDMAEKPTKHIIFKATKDTNETGYISESGQVFLHPLPSYALDAPSKATKKSWRNSGTQQSLVSSIDDTVYTRDTAETVFTQSENDDRDNYEEYLRGDLSAWKQNDSSSSSSEDESTEVNTPDFRDANGTRAWVESSGSKVYVRNKKTVSDEGSSSSPAVAKKKKKKRANPRPTRDAAKKGFINPMIAVLSNKSPEHDAQPAENTNTNNNTLSVGVRDGSSDGGISSNGAPSVTEEETDGVNKREGSGLEISDQSDTSRHLNQSQEELVEL